MAYRDLTKTFKELRNNLHRDHNIYIEIDTIVNNNYDNNNKNKNITKQGLLTSDSKLSTIDLHRQPLPIWMDLLEIIDSDCEKIQRQIALLKEFHTRRLNVLFEDEKSQQLDEHIQQITKSITVLFHECQLRLKKIALEGNQQNEKKNEKKGTQKISSTLPFHERIVRFNIMKSRASKIQELTIQFRQYQRQFLENLKYKEIRSNKYIDNEIIESTLQNFDRIEQGFTETQLRQLNTIEIDAQQKTKDIIVIAKSINELAQLFQELNILVVEQGTILDRIDYNVDNTMQYLKVSHKEIVKAEKYQKSSQTMLCIIVLFFLIVICALILIIQNLHF